MTVCEDNNGTKIAENIVMGNEDSEEATPAVAIATSGSYNNEDEVKSMMRAQKESDTYVLAEDVYAFIFVAPVFSVPFFFSLYVIATKIIVYFILIKGINDDDFDELIPSTTTAKFFLIPVAVAMQEDLIHSFFCAANISYSPSVLEISKSATKPKLGLSFLLRTFDGAFSLIVNFYLMLTTATTLGVFLNFAALGFLQSIDDVFYELVTKGFFGDAMEHMATLCKQVEFPRRSGDDNAKLGCLRVSHLDGVFFALTLFICIVIYALHTAYFAMYLA